MKLIALMLIGAVFAACGGASASDDSAEAAFRRQLDYLEKGQYSRAYAELHPSQQAFIPETLYIECAGEMDIEIEGVKIVDTYTETTSIPGTDETAESTALTAEITLRLGLLENTSTSTYHEYLVDGEWRFAVSDGDASREGRCP
jgi:hypothetical protein